MTTLAARPGPNGTKRADEIRVTGTGRIVRADDGDDTIEVSGRSHTLSGGNGDDEFRSLVLTTVTGSVIDGGAGDDAFFIYGSRNRILGGDGDDEFANVQTGLYPDIPGQPISFDDGEIDGGAGNDRVELRGSRNRILGGEGKDNFSVEGGANTLDGGAGHDTLVIAGSGNVCDAGSGHDSLELTGSRNTLSGGTGNDTFDVAGSYNTLSGGTGNDTFDVAGSYNTLSGGEGNDSFIVWGSYNTLSGGGGVDVFEVTGGRNVVSGGDGGGRFVAVGDRNTLSGGKDRDTLAVKGSGNRLSGLGGHDHLNAEGAGANTLDGGAGNDTVLASGSRNLLLGGEGDDFLRSATGGNTLDGGSGTDVVSYASVLDRADVALAFADDGTVTVTRLANGLRDRLIGIESIEFGDGAVVRLIHGGDGADRLSGSVLYGNGGNDRLTAGRRNAYLNGGDGADTLVASFGGNTLIGGAGADLVDYGGIDRSGVTLAWGENGAATITNRKTGLKDVVSGVERLLFAGNEIVRSDHGGAGNDTLTTRKGVAALYGYDGDDSLVVSADASGVHADGGAGNDTFEASRIGNNTLAGGLGTRDMLVYGSVSQDDVRFAWSRNGSLILADRRQRGQRDIVSGFETIAFSDGTTIRRETGNEAAGRNVVGLAGDDTLTAEAGGAFLDGGAGDDRLVVRSIGGNALLGGTGVDRVHYAALSADEVKVTWEAGLSATVTEKATGRIDLLAGVETISFASGRAERARWGTTGGDQIADFDGRTDRALYALAGDDTIVSTFSGGPGHVVFDGGAGHDVMKIYLSDVEDTRQYASTLLGGDGNDSMSCMPGGMMLDGGAGDDTFFVGGAKGDTIIGGAGNDRVEFRDPLKFSSTNTLVWRSDRSVVVSQTFLPLKGGSSIVPEREPTLLSGVEVLLIARDRRFPERFREVDLRPIEGTDGSDTLTTDLSSNWNARLEDPATPDEFGRDKTPYILSGVAAAYGGEGDDRLTASSGWSWLYGENGDDTLIGSSSRQEEGGNNTLVGGSGNDVLIDSAEPGKGPISLAGYRLSGSGSLGNSSLDGGTGADTLVAGASSVLMGGAGDDLLIASYFSKLYGGLGDDTLTSLGRDRVEDDGEYEPDLFMGVLDGGDGNDDLTGRGNSMLNGGNGNDTVRGAVNDTLSGGAGNDVLSAAGTGVASLDGGAGNDRLDASGLRDPDHNATLIGGAGADTLIGSAHRDVFVFRRGFGRDVITNFQGMAGQADHDHDQLQFEKGLFRDWRDLLSRTRQVGSDVVITVDSANTVTLAGVRLADVFSTGKDKSYQRYNVDLDL